MDSPEKLLAYLSELRAENLAHAAQMEAGSFSLRERRDGEMVDITDQWVADLRRKAENLERIIRDH